MESLWTSSNECQFSQKEKNIMLYLMGCPAVFSALCCFFAVSLVFILKLYRYFIYRLAMYQVLGSFLLSISMALQLLFLNYNGTLMYYYISCKVVAFILEWSLLVKLIFTVWLTFHLFCYVVFFKNFKRLEWLYISTSILFPLLFASVPFITGSYGMAGAWCYIPSWRNSCASEDYKDGIIEQYSLYYGPATFFLS